MTPDELTDDDPLEAPTALPGLRKYPALIVGAILAGIQAYISIKGAGSLDDGFQFNPDGYMILTPVLGALGIHTQVFSQHTVDVLEPSRKKQHQAVKRAKQR